MKLFFTVLLGCLPLALADFIIVTFPKNTPDRVVKEARQAIIDAGGEITHDYREVDQVNIAPLPFVASILVFVDHSNGPLKRILCRKPKGGHSADLNEIFGLPANHRGRYDSVNSVRGGAEVIFGSRATWHVSYWLWASPPWVRMDGKQQAGYFRGWERWECLSL
ncbi:uncharacterized protein ATNIH1004_006203 [Aspergillus tanneri]|uniref:Inhibitor I9 domain-containing protein n=1 Tax=Aspergillus tanneri TaxID=1220188 RepID=A0A5M9MQD3_9EURO|nr:uncharacterized protein ATNIH1004_006203 [Aspergillus tanneri]KAA8647510.1 hypothetical protein ATNIH1004_006203 [Aspergillus tanneri]